MKAATNREAARLMSAVLCLVLALASTGMAIPMASHSAHCKSVAAQAKSGHDCCPRMVETKPACPLHSRATNKETAPMLECCQLADQRLPVQRETAAPGTQVQPHVSVANIELAFNAARRNLQRGWLDGGLRYTRPVFDAKVDLLI